MSDDDVAPPADDPHGAARRVRERAAELILDAAQVARRLASTAEDVAAVFDRLADTRLVAAAALPGDLADHQRDAAQRARDFAESERRQALLLREHGRPRAVR